MTYSVLFHLCDISRIGDPMTTERLISAEVGRGEGKHSGEWGVITDKQRFFKKIVIGGAHL